MSDSAKEITYDSTAFDVDIEARNRKIVADLGAFNIVDVKGDGHCMFRSLSVLLHGDEKKFPLIKARIAAHWAASKRELTSMLIDYVEPLEIQDIDPILALDPTVAVRAGRQRWPSTQFLLLASYAFEKTIVVEQGVGTGQIIRLLLWGINLPRLDSNQKWTSTSLM